MSKHNIPPLTGILVTAGGMQAEYSAVGKRVDSKQVGMKKGEYYSIVAPSPMARLALGPTDRAVDQLKISKPNISPRRQH